MATLNDRDDIRDDIDGDRARRVRDPDYDRPIIVRDRGGWGWLATLLTVALVAVLLWATGVLDVNFFGTSTNDGVEGGANVELNNPELQ